LEELVASIFRVQEEPTLTLKMETAGAFETPVTIYQTTQRYISEDLNVHKIPPGMSVSRLKFEPVIFCIRVTAFLIVSTYVKCC